MKAKNPQMFQMVEQAQRNQNNPLDLFKQITKNNTPEQMENFYKKIENMGFNSDVINQLKGIHTK